MTRKKNNSPRWIVIGTLCFTLWAGLSSHVTAAVGTVQVPLTTDQEVVVGQLISQTGDAFALANKPYDKRLFGVVTDPPPADGLVSVLQSGAVTVLVITSAEPLLPGDLITSSDQPGLGQKSTRSGYVIGMVSGNYQDLGNNRGLVEVILSPHYAVISNRQAAAGYAQASALIGGSPELIIRYATIAIVLYIALILAAFTFGRSARAGIIALGRNPLAKKVILVGITINLGLSMALVGVGWWLGYLILTS